jgi:translation initiation factor 1 (eIF-1/SUI1)
MARKDRVQFNIEETTEFNNPFANLQVDNLPLGDAEQGRDVRAAASDERVSLIKDDSIFNTGVPLGRVVLRRETAHRGGKSVVVIDQFAPSISGKQIQALARKLRNACGCGGTTKERRIELQGNQIGKIREVLEQEGFRVAGVR